MILLLFAVHYLCSIVSSAPTPSTSTITLGSEDGTRVYVYSTDYRSTSDIVITCLSTTLLCTWHAAHPNVREYKAAWWQHILAKLRLFILALFLPELLMTFALNQYLGARHIAKAIGNGWTAVEGHFLQMGGVIFLCNGQHRFLPPEGLLNNERNDPLFTAALEKLRGLHRAHITKDDILDRSKASGLTKWLTLGQTTWFIVQFIARLKAGLALTELEVITLAYAALNGVTLYLWWGKPLDVQCPVVIELDVEGSGPCPSNTVTPIISQPIEQTQPSSSHFWQFKLLIAILAWVLRCLNAVYQVCDQVSREMESERELKSNAQHIQNPFDSIIDELEDVTNDAPAARSIFALIVIILLLPLIIVAMIVLTAIIFSVTGVCLVIHDTVLALSRKHKHPSADWIAMHHAFAPFYYAYTPELPWTIPKVVLRLLGSVFGALHCIGWSLSFASARHSTIWRVCSLVITFTPLVGAAMVPIIMVIPDDSEPDPDVIQPPPVEGQTTTLLTPEGNAEAIEPSIAASTPTTMVVPTEGNANETAGPPDAGFWLGWAHTCLWIVGFIFGGLIVIVGILYIPARAILVVLAFLNLSSMPATAHQSLEWSSFVPHL